MGQVRTRFEFRSSSFPALPGEEGEVAPGRWGKRLAELLAAGLRAEGWAVDEVASLGWGWKVSIENTAFPLWVGCRNEPQAPDAYLVFLEPDESSVRRFFRRIDTTEIVGRLAASVETILRRAPDIRDLAG
jgi:hypothetical protein